MRLPSQSLNEMVFHEGQITALEWHPTRENYCTSGSDDGKVFVWDISKSGEEQGDADYEDGPPELVFHHLAHSSQLEDLSFCQRDSKSFFPFIVSAEV